MSDIVEKLRRMIRTKTSFPDYPPVLPLNPDGPEAADEIVRLRADLDERTRERDEAFREKAAAMGLAQGSGALADQMRAERDRLRDALTTAREDILQMARSRGSEVEGTDEDLVGYIDAALKGDTNGR